MASSLIGVNTSTTQAITAGVATVNGSSASVSTSAPALANPTDKSTSAVATTTFSSPSKREVSFSPDKPVILGKKGRNATKHEVMMYHSTDNWATVKFSNLFRPFEYSFDLKGKADWEKDDFKAKGFHTFVSKSKDRVASATDTASCIARLCIVSVKKGKVNCKVKFAVYGILPKALGEKAEEKLPGDNHDTILVRFLQKKMPALLAQEKEELLAQEKDMHDIAISQFLQRIFLDFCEEHKVEQSTTEVPNCILALKDIKNDELWVASVNKVQAVLVNRAEKNIPHLLTNNAANFKTNEFGPVATVTKFKLDSLVRPILIMTSGMKASPSEVFASVSHDISKDPSLEKAVENLISRDIKIHPSKDIKVVFMQDLTIAHKASPQSSPDKGDRKS